MAGKLEGGQAELITAMVSGGAVGSDVTVRRPADGGDRARVPVREKKESGQGKVREKERGSRRGGTP